MRILVDLYLVIVLSATGLEENPNSQIMTLLTINKAISHFTLQKF